MQNAKIMIVDDDTDFVFSTRTVLEQLGYEVSSASNSSHGKAMLGREKPDLVILDVIMSSALDGLNMSRYMKDEPSFRDIPIIMVTSIANSDYSTLFPTDDSIEIDAFLTKPIKPSDLKGKVEELLGKRGAQA
jgi:CheY-like chemotaxis protein